ncbi:hypothetical protein [Paracidobacterium acidisoli]|uniref:Uncharacterized protein n=1 Tax=Paracidobacterium acidisoli TaxID=2303751 RepID=A0A372IKN1_9BACT|nr:hypothetical protein [Paracidobacterium acidisoli]MBT9332893.1 hypothetical protein [Paracidobacterium acidisoli]
MSNIFVKLGVGIADVGKWVADAVKGVVDLATKIETILKAEKPLEAPFVAGLSTVMADVEALISASESAVSADGLNFPADSRVYSEFLTLISDFKKLAPVVEQAIAILNGKPAVVATTATASAAAPAPAPAVAKN